MNKNSKQTKIAFAEIKKRSTRNVKTIDEKPNFSPRKVFSEIQPLSFIVQSPSKKRFLHFDDKDQNIFPAKKVCSPKTPSSVFAKLRLETPEGVRAAKTTEGAKPKKELFPTEYQLARKAFHNSAPDALPGREQQLSELKTSLLNYLKEENSGSIYISGPPGTGKTASLNKIINDKEIKGNYHVVYVNCTAIQSAGAVFSRIITGLQIKSTGKTEKKALGDINKYLAKKHKMILLVLDEIDQLTSRTQSVLYTIFEWPSRPHSKIVLIGIANAMDLTDRILPRLCTKVELKPKLMHFTAYTRDEIVNILKHRLSEAGVSDDRAESALQLIAGKVAASSGDIRKALDLSKRVIEMSVEKEESFKRIEDAKAMLFPDTPKKRTEVMDSPRRTPRKLSPESNNLKNKLEIFESPRRSPRKQGPHIDTFSPRKKLELVESTRRSPRKQAPQIDTFSAKKKIELVESLRSSPRKGTPHKVDILSPRKKLEITDSPRRSPRKAAFRLDPKDVMSVVKNVYGTSKSLKSDETSYPFHQKLLICSLLLVLKKGKNKSVNVGQLHRVYTKVCAKRSISGVDQSGFIFLCRQVEMTGVLSLGKGPGKMSKVSLQWDESEVSNALKDQNLLASVMNDVTCLG